MAISPKRFEDIASNDDVKVVYIVLPNSMHREFVLRMAVARKHIREADGDGKL